VRRTQASHGPPPTPGPARFSPNFSPGVPRGSAPRPGRRGQGFPVAGESREAGGCAPVPLIVWLDRDGPRRRGGSGCGGPCGIRQWSSCPCDHCASMDNVLLEQWEEVASPGAGAGG